MYTQFIDVYRLIQQEAIEVYRLCPKIITVITHADRTDDSEFHCIWSGILVTHEVGQEPETRPYEIKKVFLVPKQTVRRYTDPKLGEYLAVLVRPQFDIKLYPATEFWLFVRKENSSGFLVPLETDIGEYELRKSQKSRGLQEALSSATWFDDEK
jgi:hypothetical protein